MNQIKKPRVKRISLKNHKATKIEVVALVSLVVLVGAALVYKSFAGSNAKYVPKGVTNLRGYGRAIRVNPSATGGYAMDGHGQLFAFAVGTTSQAPYTLPTSFYSAADTARDFEVLNWSNPSLLVLTKDGLLHGVGIPHNVRIEESTTNTARKIIMYDARRGYIFDGSGQFIRFALDGAEFAPAVRGLKQRGGQDFYRSATLNPNKQNGYVVSSDGNVYEFGVGGNAVAPAISAGTDWPGVDKAVDITLTNWKARQGYVIASDGGWYAFNGAPNDYNKKSGAPFNFGYSIRGFHRVGDKAGFEISKDGTVYVFSLPNFLVAQNDKEIYPPSAKPFRPEGPLAYSYYRMPAAPNGEYDFYNPNTAPFNTQKNLPDTDGTPPNSRCGSLNLVNMIYKVSVQWKTTYGKNGSHITVGDLNAAGHESHDKGIDVDIRTSDLSAANLTYANARPYVRDYSVQLSKWLIDGGARLILYNDTAVQAQVNAYARTKGITYNLMQSYPGHDDHMHVRIGAKSQYNNPLALKVTAGCP